MTQAKASYEFIAYPYECPLGSSPDVTVRYVIHDRDLSLPDIREQFDYFLKAAGYSWEEE